MTGTAGETITAPRAPLWQRTVGVPSEEQLFQALLARARTKHDGFYFRNQLPRLHRTMALVPTPSDETSRLLDVGGGRGVFCEMVCRWRGWTPEQIEVMDEYAGLAAEAGFGGHAQDIERSMPWGIDAGRFEVVLCMEVLEHFQDDPVGVLREINRVTRPGGSLVLTTPNVHSWRSIEKILTGRNPLNYSEYEPGSPMAHHHREYTFGEVVELLRLTGYRAIEAFTFPPMAPSGRSLRLLRSMLRLASRTFCPHLRLDELGETTFVVARKERDVRALPDESRYPSWLYFISADDPRFEQYRGQAWLDQLPDALRQAVQPGGGTRDA